MIIENLIKIANKLDECGKFEYADSADKLSSILAGSLSENGAHLEDKNGDVLEVEGVITKVYDKDSEKFIPEEHKHGKSYMALPLLEKIHRLSGELCVMIDEGEPVDDWMETYISQMSKMIDDIHTKIFYKLKKDCK